MRFGPLHACSRAEVTKFRGMVSWEPANLPFRFCPKIPPYLAKSTNIYHSRLRFRFLLKYPIFSATYYLLVKGSHAITGLEVIRKIIFAVYIPFSENSPQKQDAQQLFGAHRPLLPFHLLELYFCRKVVMSLFARSD